MKISSKFKVMFFSGMHWLRLANKLGFGLEFEKSGLGRVERNIFGLLTTLHYNANTNESM